MDDTAHAWIIIPARGGSVGIPRKNLRVVGGKPLIRHVIDTSLAVLPANRIVVVTDDAEISEIAVSAGVRSVVETDFTPPEETLDTKVVRNLPVLRGFGAGDQDPVLTVQPTSPLLTVSSLRAAIARLALQTVQSVLTVTRDQHLRWGMTADGSPLPLYTARVNRQALPLEYRETGGIIGARLVDIERRGTRVIEPVEIIELPGDEAIDIDNWADLLAVAHLMSRLTIAIRVDASRELGMGHVYRMLALASEMSRHRITLYMEADKPLGLQFMRAHPYQVVEIADKAAFEQHLRESAPDLVVFDVLDTYERDILCVRRAAPRAKVVSFEDLGSGAAAVDLLVTEFVENPGVPEARTLAGIQNALLAPGFETVRRSRRVTESVDEVLVLFGGTDPSGLAERALASLGRVGYTGHVSVARGLGAPAIAAPSPTWSFEADVFDNVTNMAELMHRADIAFTSAGRTVVELLSQGTPAICMAQNAKELTHSHATPENGVLPLGLGRRVSDEDLDAATRQMLFDREARQAFAARARSAGEGRSNRATISALLGRLGFESLEVR